MERVTPGSMIQRSALTYDEVLTKHVGEFGRGQQLIVAFTSLFYWPNVIFFYLLVFVAVDPIKQRRWECVDSTDAECMAVWDSVNPGQRFCQLSDTQWRWVNHDNLAAYFNLVCGDGWKVQMLNMCMFIGCLIGAALFGYLNDSYGRKRPLLLATIICIVSVFASIAAPTYWYMAIARVLIGIGGAGQTQCVNLLNAEIAGRSRRGMASVLGSLFWSAGEFMLVGFALALPNWRHLTLLAGCMTTAALSIFFIVPESARWLLSQGRQEEAAAVVCRIAAWNGTKMPDVVLVAQTPAAAAPDLPEPALDEDMYNDVTSGQVLEEQQAAGAAGKDAAAAAVPLSKEQVAVKQEGSESLDVNIPADRQTTSQAPVCSTEPVGLFAAMKNVRLLKRTCVMVFTWFALYIVSYGVNLGAGSLPGSLYMTFSLLVVAELCAQLSTFLVADKAGRHNIITLGLVLSGSACLACATTTNSTARAILAVFGKFGCTVGLVVLGTFSCELFATPIRASAMGIFNEAGRLGSIVAPLMLMVGAQVDPDNAVFVPFLAFGVAALLAGVLTMVLPETLGAAMPEDIEDMNQLVSLFTAKPWQQGYVATFIFLFRSKALQAARGAQSQQQRQSQQPKQKLAQKETHSREQLIEVHVN